MIGTSDRLTYPPTSHALCARVRPRPSLALTYHPALTQPRGRTWAPVVADPVGLPSLFPSRCSRLAALGGWVLCVPRCPVLPPASLRPGPVPCPRSLSRFGLVLPLSPPVFSLVEGSRTSSWTSVIIPRARFVRDPIGRRR